MADDNAADASSGKGKEGDRYAHSVLSPAHC